MESPLNPPRGIFFSAAYALLSSLPFYVVLPLTGLLVCIVTAALNSGKGRSLILIHSAGLRSLRLPLFPLQPFTPAVTVDARKPDG